jgi:hypothetical protein
MAKREASAEISGGPLSQAEIEAFVAAWYRKLDIHAPWAELQPLVAEQGLEMQFPEGALSGVEAFRNWYEGVTRIFFDEVHTVTRVSATWKEDRAVVDVVVNWQARRWRPPGAPRSEWLGFDAYQQWDMIRSPASGSPVIRRYVVNELRPMPGSKPL